MPMFMFPDCVCMPTWWSGEAPRQGEGPMPKDIQDILNQEILDEGLLYTNTKAANAHEPDAAPTVRVQYGAVPNAAFKRSREWHGESSYAPAPPSLHARATAQLQRCKHNLTHPPPWLKAVLLLVAALLCVYVCAWLVRAVLHAAAAWSLHFKHVPVRDREASSSSSSSPSASSLPSPHVPRASSSSSVFDVGASGDRRREEGGGASPARARWCVHLTDLHLSRDNQGKSRARDLMRLAKFVQQAAAPDPPCFIVTGDLTDSKDGAATGGQHLGEWEMYAQFVATVEDAGGVLLDLPGNHDRFAVPEAGGAYDLFHNHSSSGTKKRSRVYAHNHGDVLLVGVDLSPVPGPNRPLNFFGVADQPLMDQLSDSLAQSAARAKIVFGHYPMSAVVYPGEGGPGSRATSLKKVLTNHSAASYLSGHLHTTFSAEHRVGPLACNEWGLADWKRSRAFRVVGWNGRHLAMSEHAAAAAERLAPAALVLEPRHADATRSLLLPTSEPAPQRTRDRVSVHALVLASSPLQARSVVAAVHLGPDGKGPAVALLPLSRLHPEGVEWVGNWTHKVLRASTLYSLVLVVEDAGGGTVKMPVHPFVAHGHPAPPEPTWRSTLLGGVDWPRLVSSGFVALLVGSLLTLLIVPRVVRVLLTAGGLHEVWETGCLDENLFEVLQVPLALLWALTESASNTQVWLVQIGYGIYLASGAGPWFYAALVPSPQDAQAEWIGRVSPGWLAVNQSQDATPNWDTFAVCIPIVLLVLIPGCMWLSARVALRCLHSRCVHEPPGPLKERLEIHWLVASRRLCGPMRWLGTLSSSTGLSIALLLSEGYGVSVLLWSPGLAWPLVMGALESYRAVGFQLSPSSNPNTSQAGGVHRVGELPERIVPSRWFGFQLFANRRMDSHSYRSGIGRFKGSPGDTTRLAGSPNDSSVSRKHYPKVPSLKLASSFHPSNGCEGKLSRVPNNLVSKTNASSYSSDSSTGEQDEPLPESPLSTLRTPKVRLHQALTTKQNLR